MNKKMIKILTMITTILCVIFIATSSVWALTPPDQIPITDPQSTDIQNFGGKIIGILQTAGTVIAVVILIILGLKYMMGSAEEKAEYKKTMIPYVIGAVCIFLAPTIATVVYNVAISFK